MSGTWYPPADLLPGLEQHDPSAGTGGLLLQHPRIDELPETYRHPRHFWIFSLPEMETRIWLGRFRQSEEIWLAAQAEREVEL